MEDRRDWALSANGGVATADANDANANDGNDSTWALVNPPQTGICEVVFSNPVYLDELKVLMGSGVGPGGGTTYLQYYDGTWHTVFTQAMPSPNTVWFGGSITPAKNVTKIRLTTNYPGRVHTLSGSGYVILDKGLRVEQTGAATKKLGVQSLESTHKVRVSVGGTTYGLALVDTTHELAGPVRLYDGTGVKAVVVL